MYGEGSPRKVACWTSASRWTSSARPAPGSTSARLVSVRAARPSKDFLKANPAIGAEIEQRIRGRITEVAIPVEGIEEAE